MIEFRIQPRASGKTPWIKKQYQKSPEESLIIVHKEFLIHEFKKVGIMNVQSIFKLKHDRRISFKNIYFDEFFLMDISNEFLDFLEFLHSRGKNIFLVGTPIQKLSKSLYQFILKYSPEELL